VAGMVFGMQCWGYKDKADRPQLGIKGRHDRWGFYMGRDVDTWAHVLYDPYTHQLCKYGWLWGNPNVLMKDVMGAQNQLRLEVIRAARGCSEDDHRTIMEAVERSELIRKERRLAHRDTIRMTDEASAASAKSLLMGRMLDESAMEMLEKLQATLAKCGDKRKEVSVSEADEDDEPEEAVDARITGNGGAAPPGTRRSARASKPPQDTTSWRSDVHNELLRAMRVSISAEKQEEDDWRGNKRAEDITSEELRLCLHTLATGSPEDFVRLRECDILNREPELADEMAKIAQESWRNASNYQAPRSVKEALERPDGEAEAWWREICDELDWFIKNGKVEILRDDSPVAPDEIPPYKWNEMLMSELRLMDLAQVQRLNDKQDAVRDDGATVDECFDILRWTWMFVRKMMPVLEKSTGKPTGKEMFKKPRARACIMGNEQCEMQTYGPLRISASVVHPASFHIVNIIIVSFAMNIFKIDDPKAFCKGDADYPIYTKVPRGVEHVEKYAPHGKRTRWKVIGAIYGLIQASLRYFLKSSEVMEGLGFIQCPFDKTVFIKWFESQTRFLLFWQHVDDRWGGYQTEGDLNWFLQALEAQLQSAQEATTDVLGLDVEYHKGQGTMRLRAQTKITSFIEREQLHGRITPHDTPMTPGIAKAMTKKNCPVTDLQKKEMKSKASQYRTYAGFFGYATNTVHVNCKNVARLLSRFLSNPGLEHHKAVMYALGYLYHHCDVYIEYKRSKNFEHEFIFRIFVMVDADLGGDDTRGNNGNSVMAGICFLNECHCYSYSKTIKAVCLATHHTEYYALTEGSQMAIYIARLLRSLKFKAAFPVPVVGDNKGALATASVPATKQSRHINLREHWIRDVLTNGDLVLGFIAGTKNVANLLTKVLAAAQFKRESEWALRGIHSDVYQAEILETLKEVWMRIFVWNKERIAREAKALESNRSDEAATH
jgi:hypothetical protein